MSFFAKYSVWYTVLITASLYLWLFLTNWPKQFLIPYGINAYITHILWTYYVSPHAFSILFIFHQINYFLELRFIHANKNLQNILKSHKLNPAINRSTELIQILQKHNQFCLTVSQFNKFWSFELLMDAILYSSMILVLAYISFLTAIDILLKIYFGSFAIIIILCFSSLFFSAASVATQV